jgi:hypothetical protein
MSEQTALATIPKESALSVFSVPLGLDPYLAKIREEIDTFTPDLSTKKGRDAIASIAFKVAKSKTYLDGVGKELVDELKQVPAKVDAERKRMRDLLDAWKNEVRQPLTEWEAAEEARILEHKRVIVWLATFLTPSDLSAADVQAQLDEVSALEISEAMQEFEAETARAKDAALTALRSRLEVRQKHEAEQEELARHRAEEVERERIAREQQIAREATERAEREAEQRAQDERDATVKREAEAKAAADKRELELKLEAEASQRRELEAKQRAEQAEREAEAKAEQAAQAVIQRQADEEAAEKRAAAAREADTKHKAAINREAMAAFMVGGMTEECAKQAVTLIARRAIPHIAITY